MMQVHLVNDGPVTIPLDSRKFTYDPQAQPKTKPPRQQQQKAQKPSKEDGEPVAQAKPSAEAAVPDSPAPQENGEKTDSK